MKHKAKLNISRPHYGDGRKKIAISVIDDDAGVEFLEIEIGLEEFSECLTGLGNVDCLMDFRKLDCVGKQIERDSISFKMPQPFSYGDKEAAEIEAKKHTPDGWICQNYFGSQRSFFDKDGETWAQTGIRRWVEKA